MRRQTENEKDYRRRGVAYAIRLSANDVLERAIEDLLTRPRGRPSHAPLVRYRFVLGPPPKVVWIRRGNCSTAEIKEILRARQTDLLAFEQDAHGAFLALG